MFTRLRAMLYRTITSDRGNSLAAIRIPKGLARRLNETLGQPLATQDELTRRKIARTRLEELKSGTGGPSSAAGTPAKRPSDRPPPPSTAALPPILLYFERDRNTRELADIEELLGARNLPWKRLDVTGDDATLEFILRRAKCERDELPLVFVADRPIGGFAALAKADAAGDLARLGA